MHTGEEMEILAWQYKWISTLKKWEMKVLNDRNGFLNILSRGQLYRNL